MFPNPSLMRTHFTKAVAITALFLTTLTQFVSAQTVVTMNQNSQTVTGCNFVLYDNGGPNGPYSNNMDRTITICSPNGEQIRLDISFLDIERSFDDFIIYDGNSTAASVMFNSSGGSAENYNPQIIVSSGSCITIRLDADGSNFDPEQGFEIFATCFEPLCENTTPAGNTCQEATPICSNSEYCGSTRAEYTDNAPGNLDATFCGSIENNSFLSFTAASTSAVFEVAVWGCTGSSNGSRQGVQFQVYSSTDCNTFTTRGSCFSPGIEQGGNFTATGLTFGQQYYIMIDGFAGDNCNYSIKAISGVQLPANAGPDQVVCGPSIVQMAGSVNPPTSTGYYWIAVGDGTFNNVNNLNARYTPGPNDIANGSTQIVLYNPAATACLDIKSDTMNVVFKDVVLNISPSDPAVCKGNSVTLTATATPAIPANSNTPYENTNTYRIPDDGVATSFAGTTGNYGSSPLVVDCVNPDSWSLTQYCVNSNTDQASSLEGFWLVNPCGNVIRVANDNATLNGCFAPGTTAAWTTFLSCATPNGTWEIRSGDSDPFSDIHNITYFSLTFNSSNYQWSPATGLNTTTGPSVIATPTTTTTYTVTVRDCEAGCSVIKDVTVKVSDMLLTGTPTNISCFGANDGSIAITATGGVTPYQYSINGGTTYQASNSFSGLAPGTYTIRVKDAAGCEKTFTQVISQPTQLVLSSTVASACVFGNTGEINSTATGGTTPYQFSIDGTNFQSSGNFTGLAPGSYTVTLKDNRNCIKTKTLTIGETPNADFTIAPPACDSKATQLTTVATVGTGTLSGAGVGLITFTPNSAPTGSTHAVNASSFGTFTITHKVTNGSCSATVAKDVTFTREPVANFNFTNPTCGDVSALINVVAPVGTISWTISPNDGSTINATGNTNEYQFNANAFTAYTLTLNLNNNPCTDNISKTITFIEKPNPQIAPVSDVCGKSTTLNASIYSGSFVNWRSLPNAGVTFANPNSANTSVSVTNFGTYSFIINEAGDPSCASVNDTVVVTFFEAPSGDAGKDTSVCAPNGHKLNGRVFVGTGIWSAGIGINNATDLQTTISPGTVGSYTYTLSVSNGVCPVFTDDVVFTIDQLPVVDLNPDQLDVCGLDAPLNGISTVGVPLWTAKDPATIANPNVVNTTATNDVYGTNRFYFSMTNGSCPSVLDSIDITFEEAPVPMTMADASICGKTIDLTATYSLPSNNGFWTGPGVFSPSSNINNTNVTVSNFGTYTFTWTENGSSICPSESNDVNITFLEQPDAKAGIDQQICGTTTTLNANASSGTGTWTYVAIAPANAPVVIANPNDPFTSISIDTTGVGENGFGRYIFTWTEANGSTCPADADDVEVYFVPNRSPNVGIDLDVCGDTAFLNAQNVYESGVWSVSGPGSILFSNVTDPSAIASLDPANFVYGKYRFVWIENFSPCTPNNKDTLFVEYFEPPVVSAGVNPDQVCGLDAQLNAQITVGQGKWTWVPVAPNTGSITFGGGNDSIPNPPISASDYGTYNLYWNVENGTCLPPNDSIEFTFFEKPTPTATGPQDVCSTDPNQSFNLDGVSSSGTLWTWNGPAGVTFNPDENTPNVVADVTQFGSYKFYYNEINHPVCGVVKDSISVDVLEQPTTDAGVDAQSCGATYQLQAAITTGAGTGTWTIIDQNPAGSVITFSDINNPNSLVTITPAPPAGDFTQFGFFRFTVQSGVSCLPVSDSVRIDFRPSTAFTDAGPDSTLCGTLDYTFQASAAPGGETGTWTIDNGPKGPGLGGTFVNVNDESTTITVDTAGVYTFKWSVSNSACGLPIVDLVVIDFRITPTPAAGIDEDICGLTYNLAATKPLGRIKGFWSYVQDNDATVATFGNILSPLTSVTLAGDSAYGPQKFVWNEFNGLIGECSDTLRDTLQITFYQAPVANGLSIRPVCGQTGRLLADTSISTAYLDDYSSYWEYIPSNGATMTFTPNNQIAKPQISTDKFGTYYFVWHESNGVCPSTTDTVDFIFVPPSKPQAGFDVDSCSLSAVIRAIPSFGQGEWQLDTLVPHSFANSFDPQTLLTVSGYGNYKVIWVEESSPCPSNQDTLIVKFNQKPVTLAIPPTDVCGDMGTLLTRPSISSPNLEGTWTSSPSISLLSPNNDTTLAQLNSGYGEFDAIYTERNGAVCPEDFKSTKINFIEEPISNAGIDSVICGRTINLYATPSVGNGSWSLASALSSGTATFNQPSNPNTKVTVNNFGIYTFIWKETNFGKYNLNCENADTVVIEFLQQPAVVAPIDFSVCGKDAVLNAPSTVSGAIRTWAYNGPSTEVSVTSSNPSFANSGTDFGFHTFTVTESNRKCISTDDVTVEFIEQPVASTIANYDTCGFRGILRANPHVGTGKWTYTGTGTVNITAPTSDVSSVTVSQFGSHQFVWQVENKVPCTIARDTLTVNFIKMPVAQAPADISVCGPVANLNATPSVGIGQWTSPDVDPVGFSNPNSPSTTASLIAPNVASYHTYKYIWTETNGGLCTSKDSVEVTYREPPLVNIEPDKSTCGLTETITATVGIGTLRWDYLGNPLNFNGFSAPTSAVTDVSVNTFGVHRFRIIQNNGGACAEDTAIIAISFFDNPVAQAGPDDSICGFTYELQAVASIGNGTWTKTSGPGTVTFQDNSDPNSAVTVSQEGEYVLQWSETNGICGPFTDDITIFFEEQPVANAGLDITICDIQTTLGATSTRFGGIWTLLSGPDIANSTYSSTTDPNALFTAAEYGIYTMVWTEENKTKCAISTDTLVVRLVEEPNAVTGGDLAACSDTIFLNGSRSVGNSYWKQISGPGTVMYSDSSMGDTKSWVENFGFGTYRLAWIEDNGGACPISSDTIEVKYVEQPIVDAGLDTVFCGLSGNFTAYANAGGLSWTQISGPGTSIIYNTQSLTSDIDVSAYGTYVFELRSNNESLCTDQDQVAVTFIEQPTAFAGVDDFTCGLTVELGAVMTTGTGGEWLTTNVNPGAFNFDDVNDPLADVTVSNYGVYSFIWSEFHARACQISYDTVLVEFNEQPVVDLGLDTTVCGDSAILMIPSIAGTGLWSSPNSEITFGPDATADTVIAYASVFGTFEIVYTSTNKAPCVSASDSRMVTFIDQPTVSIVTPDTVCIGSDVTVDFTFTGVAPFDVNLEFNGQTVNLTGINSGYQHTFTNATATDSVRILSVFDGSASSCPLYNPTSEQVVVIALPTATISGNSTVCFGDSAFANIFFSGFAPFTVQFSNGDNFTYNGDTIYGKDFFADESVTITSVSDKYCVGNGIGQMDVTVNPLPDAQFNIVGPTQVCDGDPVNIEFVVTQGTPTFDIAFVVNGTDTTLANNINSGDITPIYGNVGNNTIKLITVTDDNNPQCSNTFAVDLNFTVNPKPSVVITSPDNICEGDNFVIDFVFSGVATYDFTITNNGTTNLIENVNSNYSLTLNPTQDETYIIGTIFDGSSTTCSTVLDSAINVHVVPRPVVTTSVDVDEVCFGESIVYTINVVGEGPFDITYNVGNGNETVLGSTGTENITVVGNTSTQFIVVDVQDASGLSCPIVNATPIDVIINPIPMVDFTSPIDNGCKPFTALLEPILSAGETGGTFVWSNSNGDTSYVSDPSFVFLNDGSYDVTLSYTSAAGCSNTETKTGYLTVHPDPVANFEYLPLQPTVTNNNVYFTNTSIGASTYNWTFGEFGTSTDQDPLFLAPNDDQYEIEVCLEALSQFACRDTVCDIIKVIGDVLVYVPNTFTPNGDNINDFLYLSAQGVEYFKIEIFNRWGQKVFTTENPADLWNGEYKGTVVQEGVYPYVVYYKDKYSVDVQKLRGHINIIR